MAALLLSAADILRIGSDAAAGAVPGGYGDWRWCDACRMWVCGAWQAHEAGNQHPESLRLIEVCCHSCRSYELCCTHLPLLLVNGRSVRFDQVDRAWIWYLKHMSTNIRP